MYCNCTATVLQMYCNCTATVLQMYCKCTATVLQLYWNCTEIVLQIYHKCTANSAKKNLSVQTYYYEYKRVPKPFQNGAAKLCTIIESIDTIIQNVKIKFFVWFRTPCMVKATHFKAVADFLRVLFIHACCSKLLVQSSFLVLSCPQHKSKVRVFVILQTRGQFPSLVSTS